MVCWRTLTQCFLPNEQQPIQITSALFFSSQEQNNVNSHNNFKHLIISNLYLSFNLPVAKHFIEIEFNQIGKRKVAPCYASLTVSSQCVPHIAGYFLTFGWHICHNLSQSVVITWFDKYIFILDHFCCSLENVFYHTSGRLSLSLIWG